MRVTAYQPGDEAAVARVWGTADGRRDPTALWRWRHLDHPDAPKAPYAALGWRGDQLCVVRDALPAPALFGGRLVRAALICAGPSKNADATANPDVSGSWPISTIDLLPQEPEPPPPTLEERIDVLRGLLGQLQKDGNVLAYALAESLDEEQALQRLGFEKTFVVALRNLYLSFGQAAPRFDSGVLEPVRRFAQGFRSIREKLIEMEVDERSIHLAASLFAQRRDELGFAIDRTERYLAWRYQQHPDNPYRMLVLRRKAGVGIDAFVVVRMFTSRAGRRYVQLVDHWTRFDQRRSTAWLMGELAMWGFAEKADVLQAFAAAGSPLEQVLVGTGGIKKKVELPFMVKRLAGDDPLGAELAAATADLRAGDFDLY